jgi:hypothetical protein
MVGATLSIVGQIGLFFVPSMTSSGMPIDFMK